MKFPYACYAVDPLPTSGGSTDLYRPEIPFRLIGPTAGRVSTMNANYSQRRRLWLRFAGGVAFVLAVTLVASLGYAAWEYTTWRNKMIEWDYGTIDRLCGGDTEEDRLLEIRFVKQWEYKALKRMPDGKEVWLRWKLSKRHCGNWMLVDKPKGFVIRPFEIRFPNGAPHRDAVYCLGIPIDENEKYKRRDEVSEALRRTSSPR